MTAAQTQPTTSASSGPAADPLPLDGIDHVEFYVGNAYQAAHFYKSMFGFTIEAYRGLETGCRDRASYVVSQHNVRLVLTTALCPDHEIASHVQKHGDGVKSIAIRVKDVDQSIKIVKSRGATVVQPPTSLTDEHGELRVASIKAYGDTVHTFISREKYGKNFAPGFRPTGMPPQKDAGLRVIDHMVGNVELRMMKVWVDFYREVMGFEQIGQFDDKQISTEYSALMSKVMSDGSGKIKFPINEPAEGKRKSQIEEYLDYYRGPGVQHIAMLTGNIFETVRTLRSNGVRFLRVPDTYYEALPGRMGEIKESLTDMHELGILMDKDEDGYLLQIFTQPVEDRPTLFYEIIERHGSRGFGVGNFKALFVSIEEEQKRRGNL